MNPEIFAKRREKLCNALENGEAAIIFAADEPHGITRFTQNNNFLYLTGLYELPEAIYVVAKNKDQGIQMLFIQRNIPERIVWDGAKMYPEEATEISGIDNVKFIDQFESDIFPYVYNAKKIYINSGVSPLDQPLNKALMFVSNFRQRVLKANFEEANLIMTPLRQIKDELEIENLTKAIEITGHGLQAIFANARADMYEYELEAMLFYEMRRRNVTNYGFAPIIAGGKNATTLHYKQNNMKINDGDLVLCDVGAAYNGYSADITRTFPIAKAFSPRQREVYAEVLNVQKTMISQIKPGVSMVDLNKMASEMIGEACVKLKLIADKEEFKKHYMHSLGHHLGLDTHDLGSREATLEPGMVLTIEPGIYIPEEKIGIRIEDDILVTKDGYKVLSHMIPKEIEELENIRSKVLTPNHSTLNSQH